MILPTADQRGLGGSIFSLDSGPPSVSFEFFPPKTEAMEERLWDSIKKLEPLSPDFISVTYGAGGSTRDRTHATIQRILNETKLRPAAHLTCVGASRNEVDAVTREYHEMGVRHIVALRGDPPPGTDGYSPHPGGYERASDLVAGLMAVGDFEISVAAYPEMHPESPNLAADLENLKQKVEAGASRAITQFFFRDRPIFPISRPLSHIWNRDSDRAGNSAGDQRQAAQEICQALRRNSPRLDGSSIQGS